MLVSVCVHIRVRVCVIVRVVRTVFVCGCRCRRCCCLSAVAGRCCVVVEVCLLLLFAVTLSSVCLSAQILGAHEATPRRNIGARGLPVHHPRLPCFAVRTVVRIILLSFIKKKKEKAPRETAPNPGSPSRYDAQHMSRKAKRRRRITSRYDGLAAICHRTKTK